jgi:hypothetical protein
MSGTSVAASMAAGVALLALQDNRNCNAGFAKSAVITWCTNGKLTGLGGDSNNRLLNFENYGLAIPPASVSMMPDMPSSFSGECLRCPSVICLMRIGRRGIRVGDFRITTLAQSSNTMVSRTEGYRARKPRKSVGVVCTVQGPLSVAPCRTIASNSLQTNHCPSH